MKILHTLLIFSLTLSITSCSAKTKKEITTNPSTQETQYKNLEKYQTAYFASGCFWCVEAIFESVKGVKEVISGYSGGTQKNPTYRQVGSGNSDHAEAVEVYYNPKIISYLELVQVFFGSHDPTQLNGQGPDHGRQYRSIAFYKNDNEKHIINSYISALKSQDVYSGAEITTEVTAFTKFYNAENYHQNYERENPNNSYVRNVSIPRLNRFKANFSNYLKKNEH